MSPIEELRQCLQDAQSNRLQADPSQTDLKWTGFIEGLKHAIHRLEMATPKNPHFLSDMKRYYIPDPDLIVQTRFGKLTLIAQPDKAVQSVSSGKY